MWKEEKNKITKTFEFSDFSAALEFVNKVGALADKADHHPDICLHDYKKVTITLSTHSEGKVTDKDHKLASEIDNI